MRLFNQLPVIASAVMLAFLPESEIRAQTVDCDSLPIQQQEICRATQAAWTKMNQHLLFVRALDHLRCLREGSGELCFGAIPRASPFPDPDPYLMEMVTSLSAEDRNKFETLLVEEEQLRHELILESLRQIVSQK